MHLLALNVKNFTFYIFLHGRPWQIGGVASMYNLNWFFPPWFEGALDPFLSDTVCILILRSGRNAYVPSNIHFLIQSPDCIWHLEHMFRCTVNRTFYSANPSTPKHFIRQFFSVPIVSYRVLDGGSYKKFQKKIDFCHFFRDVLSLGWGGMGVL